MPESFKDMRRRLVAEGRLFVDRDFPASGRSLRRDRSTPPGVRWLRPSQISKNPEFIIKGATKFDLHQGKLGDCWFVAAVACLADTSEKLLHRLVPPDQSFDNSSYAGMFQFTFWSYNKWVEVVVDDLLPTKNGELLYVSNTEGSQTNEYWGPLLEKAYAKMYGCYENIQGGHINNALVDFTGGVSEHINLQKKASIPKNLFRLMQRTMQMNSMMGCSLSANQPGEVKLANGIYANHAYSITAMATIGQNQVLRLRNPWGRAEYTGAWSDSSREWNRVSDADKQKLGLVVHDDGEFWMPYDDWLQTFQDLNFCHLYPDALTKEVAQDLEKHTWDSIVFHNSWIKGFTAGGCGDTRPELLWTNPQYAFTVTEQDDGDSDGKCTMVVSLMQKAADLRYELQISFQIWKLKTGYPVLLDGQNYDRRALMFSREPSRYIDLREVTAHMELDPGTYVVIPCTYQPDQEGDFMLRVYTEKKATGQPLDDVSTIPSKDVLVHDECNTNTGIPIDQPDGLENELLTLFKKHSSGGLQMDGEELMAALNDYYSDRLARGFSINTARSVLAMMDKNQSGMLHLSEFIRVIKELNVWMVSFKQFDTDNSDSIDSFEMKKVFGAIGFKLSRHVLYSIVRRFGGKSRRIKIDDLTHACSNIISMYEQYQKHKNAATDKIELDIDEWLSITTLY